MGPDLLAKGATRMAINAVNFDNCVDLELMTGFSVKKLTNNIENLITASRGFRSGSPPHQQRDNSQEKQSNSLIYSSPSQN